MRKIFPLFFAFILLLQCVALGAQGLAPFRAEYRKQAKGLLTLMNDKDTPVRVTLKPQSFTSDVSGHLKLLPLDPNLNLVLSQTSLRIPPNQTRYVSYESKPNSAPAWFVIYATFVPEAPGIVVGTSVPHFAYITAGNPKLEEMAMVAQYDATKHLLHITLTSHSLQIAHVDSLETSGGKVKKDLGSLSILPGKSTVVEARMDGDLPPDVVKADFGKFKMQCPVVVK